MRLLVPPVQDENNFNALISSCPSADSARIDGNLLLTYDEIQRWRKEIYDVKLSDETMLTIKNIRKALSEQENMPYVSDRRWQRAAMLLKASAFCNGRAQTNHSDTILLKYCLWTTPENKEATQNVVRQAMQSRLFDDEIALLDIQRDEAEKQIKQELFYQEHLYKNTVDLNGNEALEVDGRFYRDRNAYINCRGYILLRDLKPGKKFNLIMDYNNIPDRNVECQFNSNGDCVIKHIFNDFEDYVFTPKFIHKKGDRKTDVDELAVNLSNKVRKIRLNLNAILETNNTKLSEYKKELGGHFVSKSEIEEIIKDFLKRSRSLKLKIADCERLEALC
ncbi:MAG: hypothetical protein LUC34_03825 [Campylobacter sp.]|nr:hypothetical protein [Campylobacter sp.]